mgnify:CR=1 FL=1
MIELIKKCFNVSEKQLIIKIKELDLQLTKQKNRDIEHLESVAIDIMECDKDTKNPLTILYITKYSALSVDKIINLNLGIDMNDPKTINTAMEMANKGYDNKHIINKVLSTN